VELGFSQQRLAKLCNDEKALVRKYSPKQAKWIQRRLFQLQAAECLEDLRNAPGHCHELAGNRSGQLSIDVDQPYRLIFVPTEIEAVASADGGIDWDLVAAVTVIEIIDTHDNYEGRYMSVDAKHFEFQPDYVVKPGETLGEVLDERRMSQAELSRRTGLSTKHINQIIGGEASITPETALRLEKVTKIPSRFWTNLESQYRELVTRQEEAELLEADLPWLDELPISELKQRGYLSKTTKDVDLLREVLTFFGVANRSAWSQVWAKPTAYRVSRVHDVNNQSVAAWLRIGEIEAAKSEAKPFDRKKLRGLIPKLRSLTLLDVSDWPGQLFDSCASVGVSIVFEKEISGSRISGVARWIDNDRALVQMSLRYKWADVFWFTFFHEIAHVLLHDRKRLLMGPRTMGTTTTLS
jgi:HTH-type transcriptional regulator/antitoxin HigA